MISIRKEIRTAEELDAQLGVARECYRTAIDDCGRFAVEVDAGVTARLREAIRDMAILCDLSPQDPEALPQIRVALGNALREHQRSSDERLKNLRRDLAETSAVLQEVLGTMEADADEHDRAVRAQLEILRAAAELPSIEEVRRGVLSVGKSLEGCIEAMQRRHQITVAQLSNEVQTLQKQLDALRRQQGERPEAGVHDRLDAELCAGAAFSIVFLRIKNFMVIRAQHGADVASSVVASCLERLRGAAPAQDTVGQWQEGVLCAIGVSWPKGEAEFARDLAWKLRGKHGIRVGSHPREIDVQVTSVALKRDSGETAQRTMTRLEEALRVL